MHFNSFLLVSPSSPEPPPNIKWYSSTVQVGIPPKKGSAPLKMSPRNILRNEIHLYGIISVHLKSNTALKQE